MSDAPTETKTRTTVPEQRGVGRSAATLAARASAAGLCLAITAIHVKDQGGFPGDKQPTYVGIGYYLLEIGAVVAAVLLLSRANRTGWVLAVAVALGPLAGYILSRGPGLPSYSDDRGQWTETLGVISLGVEGMLLLVSVAGARLSRRSDDRRIPDFLRAPLAPQR